MKVVRFLWESEVNWGIIEGNLIREISGEMYQSVSPGNVMGPAAQATILPPLQKTNKVPAIAANYGKKDERDGPGIFLKQPGTYVGHKSPVIYPRSCKKIVHEAEVGIVIGKTCRQVREEEALDYIFGYTCVNDITALELEKSDSGRGTSMRWKHFDTFCPIGPVIETDIDGQNLEIVCRVNGKTDVSGNSADMIFPIPMLISWVSEVMTLYPGDIIPTGCPEVGELDIGDTVDVQIQGIGTLTNHVIKDSTIFQESVPI